MLSYQARPRILKIEHATSLPFPAQGEIRFHFSPGQPFGVKAGGGHTAVQNVTASSMFNANTGTHEIESQQPLSPLDVQIEESDRVICLTGSTLSVAQAFKSNQELTGLIEGMYFALPMLLAVDFADPPIIERTEGHIGGVGFRWELAIWKARFEITTQEKQEQAVVTSWVRLDVLSKSSNRRLVASLHYFHVALRLARRGQIAGEFLPEMILNLSKVLEVLFPPSGGGKTRDAVRAGLGMLGFSEIEIEADYIPAMALRNEIDVGHVDLALFKVDQLAVIQGYADYAEHAFRTLFRRIFEKIEDDSFKIEPYDSKPAVGDAIKIIARMRKHVERYSR